MQSMQTISGRGFQGYTDFLDSVPPRGRAAEAPPTEPQDSVADSYVTPTSRRIESPVSLITLEKGLDEMARSHRGAGQSPVRLDTRTGQVDLAAEVRTRPLPQGQEVLPLRLGALQKSLHRISEGDPFLLGSNPIFYVDRQGLAHVDFVNLAGFIIDPLGTVMSRAVNPA